MEIKNIVEFGSTQYCSEVASKSALELLGFTSSVQTLVLKVDNFCPSDYVLEKPIAVYRGALFFVVIRPDLISTQIFILISIYENNVFSVS